MRNGIKKLFLTSLFVIFGLCFNSSFATVQTVEKGEEIVPSAGGYNTTYTQTLENNGKYILSNGTIEKELMFGYNYNSSSNHYPYFYFFCDTNDIIGMCMFRENNANSNYKYIKAIIYPYSNYKTTNPGLSYTNCQSQKPTNRTNQATCYIKEYNNFGEEYNGKLSGIYRNNDRKTTPCLIYEDIDELVCPLQVFQDGYYENYNTNVYTFANFDETMVKNPNYVQQEEPTTPTPVTWSCPTIQDLINAYPTNYNTGLCYSDEYIFSGNDVVQTTKESIFEMFPTLTGYQNFVNLYNNFCTSTITSEQCNLIINSKPKEYSLINKIPSNGNLLGIYQYCHLQLEIENKNATTCVMSTGELYATGVNEEIAKLIQDQNTSLIGLIEESIQNINEIPTLNTGYVFDELLDDGETRTDGIKLDIFKTFLILWSKLTTIFYFRNSQPGIIPEFITTIIIIIVLFKLFKK